MAMYREVGDLNPYALDYPVCLEDQSTHAGRARKYGRSQRTWLMNFMLPGLFSTDADSENDSKLSAESASSLSAIRQSLGLEPNDSYQPCAEDYMTSYLNQPSVKAALHVKEDIEWKDCSTALRWVGGLRGGLVAGHFGNKRLTVCMHVDTKRGIATTT